MSIIADLLSKLKFQGNKGDVPPGLKKVVLDDVKKRDTYRKIIAISALVLVAVLSGLATIQLIDTYIKPSKPAPSVASKAKPAPEPPVVAKTVPREEPSVTKEPVKEKASQEQPEKLAPKPIEQPPQDKKQSVNKDAKGVKAGDAKPPKKKKPKPREDAVKETAKKEKDFSPAYDSEKLQQIKPRDTQKLDAHLHIAKAYESKREYHQALQSYKRALEIDPDNYIIMNNISSVLINMGAADEKTRLSRFQEAIQYSKNALNIKKDYVPSLINLGIASLQLGNFTEGESYLTKVLSIEPSNNLAALNLAILYEKRGEHDKAYDYFSKLSSTGDIRGHLGAARILEKQGKVSEAARFYREIISKTTVDSNTKRFATERLQQLGQ